MVDDKCKEIYGNDEIVKESEKLPNKIKSSLDKGKLIDNEWNDNNKLIFNINICINIENNIKKLNLIDEKIKQSKSEQEKNNEFYMEQESYDNLIKIIKSLGKYITNSI